MLFQWGANRILGIVIPDLIIRSHINYETTASERSKSTLWAMYCAQGVHNRGIVVATRYPPAVDNGDIAANL